MVFTRGAPWQRPIRLGGRTLPLFRDRHCPKPPTPVEWGELAGIDNGRFTAQNSAERLGRDVFAEMTAAVGMQRFSSVR